MVVLAVAVLPTMVAFWVLDWSAFSVAAASVSYWVAFFVSAASISTSIVPIFWNTKFGGGDVRTDGWGEVGLELAGFDRAVEVGKIDELVFYVAAFCFGGALGEPTINPGVDCSEDAGNEGEIVCTLGIVGG